MIIEIALGIVLAVIILANLEAILALGIFAFGVTIFLGLLIIAFFFTSEIFNFLLKILVCFPIVLSVILLMGLLGAVAEKLFNLKKFGDQFFSEFPKSSRSITLYWNWLADRFVLGVVHSVILCILIVILDAKKYNYYTMAATLAFIYISFLLFRVYKKK